MTARGFNWPIWLGGVCAVTAYTSYRAYFAYWPVTRDVPWVNLLLFGLAGWLIVTGVRRAFDGGPVEFSRIIVVGGITAISGWLCVLFLVWRFLLTAGLPASANAPAVGAPAPEFTLPDEHGRPVSLSALLASPLPGAATPEQRPKAVLLIFSMYSGCRACNTEYRGMQQQLAALAQAGVRPVVISIDPPAESRQLSDEAGYTFTFLSDPKMDVIRRYDVAFDGEARPAEFLVDASGIVRWRYLTGNVYVRATPRQVIAAAASLR